MSKFTIFPAIDLMDGQVVRLKQGDPKQKTVYSTEPELMAAKWSELGAKWLHVVNLDAAFGKQDTLNLAAIEKILSVSKENPIFIQVGGGIRTLEKIKQNLGVGVSRVILGTVAVENPKLVETAVKEFGHERIIIGIDARDGLVRTHGWEVGQQINVFDFSLSLKQLGIKTIIYTDISRDGIGGGVNLSATVELIKKTGLNVIASGGIQSITDVVNVKQLGIPGVIIGRALYQGSLDPQAVFNLQE